MVEKLPDIRGGTFYGIRLRLARVLPRMYRSIQRARTRGAPDVLYTIRVQTYVALLKLATDLEEARADYDD